MKIVLIIPRLGDLQKPPMLRTALGGLLVLWLSGLVIR